MAGRFGKYGDFKRREGLKRGRKEKVHVIWRNDPPDDVLRIGPVLSLGSL